MILAKKMRKCLIIDVFFVTFASDSFITKGSVEDSAFFELLFKELYQPLYCFAHAMVSDEEECRDIVGTAYEGLWAHFHDDTEKAAAKSYLYNSVRNLCINWLRRSKMKQAYADLLEHTLPTVFDSDTFAEQEERRMRIAQVLDRMDTTTRSIFTACYVEEKKYKEVAEEMNISINTVKKYMVKALKTVRAGKAKES